MGKTLLPPGFRFHPTDVELVLYYLKRKIMGKKLHFNAMSEINIYKFSPWDLPDKSCLKSKDLEWYFFVPRERKYTCGGRMNRAAEKGYWKATGRDRPVVYKEQTIGMIKTLVFHEGHSPKGKRTDWVIHEYRIEDGALQDSYVLCKVFKKSGPGPRNGSQYVAPFMEEDWENDAEISVLPQEPDDLSSLFASFPENTELVPDQNNERNGVKNDESDIFSQLLDLDGFANVNGSRPGFVSLQEEAFFLELDDLDVPVDSQNSSFLGVNHFNEFFSQSQLQWPNEEFDALRT